MDLVTPILAALIPTAADGVRAVGRALVARLGGAQPATVDEYVKLQDADTRRLEALSALDAPGGDASQWVVNLRASARYLAVLVLVACTVLVTVSAAFVSVPADVLGAAAEWGAAGFFFLFGDRMNQHARREGR